MPQLSDAFLTELGLERSGPRVDQWGDDPGGKIWRAGLTHAVMSRMLESAEALAPFVKCDKAVVFGWLQDMVLEESDRSPYGLVAIGEGAGDESAREAARFRSMSFTEILAETARMADAHHGPPRVPEWAVPLDRDDGPHRSRR